MDNRSIHFYAGNNNVLDKTEKQQQVTLLKKEWEFLVYDCRIDHNKGWCTMGQLVDMQDALDDLGLEQEDFIELVQELKTFISDSMPQLEASIQDSNSTDLERTAHSIKGALKNLRFLKSGQIAETLEKVGAGLSDENPQALLISLKDTLAQSYEELGL